MREHDRLKLEHDLALRMLALAVNNYLADRSSDTLNVVERRAEAVSRSQAAVDAFFVAPRGLIG